MIGCRITVLCIRQCWLRYHRRRTKDDSFSIVGAFVSNLLPSRRSNSFHPMQCCISRTDRHRQQLWMNSINSINGFRGSDKLAEVIRIPVSYQIEEHEQHSGYEIQRVEGQCTAITSVNLYHGSLVLSVSLSSGEPICGSGQHRRLDSDVVLTSSTSPSPYFR